MLIFKGQFVFYPKIGESKNIYVDFTNFQSFSKVFPKSLSWHNFSYLDWYNHKSDKNNNHKIFLNNFSHFVVQISLKTANLLPEKTRVLLEKNPGFGFWK